MKISKNSIIAIILLAAIFAFSGCGVGGGGKSTNSGTAGEGSGAYHISVAWPDAERHNSNAKIIPGGTDLIDIEIDGEGLDDPILTEIPYGEDDILIENIPVGFKIALIRAIDNDTGDITSQRKESFQVMSGLTSTSDSIPLGIAITGESLNPVFVPSSIKLSCNADLYFQNWTSAPFTVTTTIPDATISVDSASEISSGQSIFPSAATKVVEFETFGIVNKLSTCDLNLANASMITGSTTFGENEVSSVRVEAAGITSLSGTYGKYLVFPIFENGNIPVTAMKAGYNKFSGNVPISTGSRTVLNISLTEAPRTERISVHTDGTQGNAISQKPSLNSDGRFVAFASSATTLILNDTSMPDVYLRDRDVNQTIRISQTSSGTAGNKQSYNPSISYDGHYIAFESFATNLITTDTNLKSDIFLYNRLTGEITRVSVASDGTEANGDSSLPSISANGRYIAFESNASNLVTGAANRQIYLHDTVSGTTSLISMNNNSEAGNNNSYSPCISGDGQFVAFKSDASNLAGGDTNGLPDIFVRNLLTGQTVLVSTNSSGVISNGASSSPSISYYGNIIAFQSSATNLISGVSGSQIYAFDRDSQEISLVSMNTSGQTGDGTSSTPSVSEDGNKIVFASTSTNLVAGISGSQIYQRDRQQWTTTAVSINSGDTIGNGESLNPVISSDGKYTAFDSDSTNLVDNDTNAVKDVFTRYLSSVSEDTTTTATGIVTGTVTCNGQPVINATVTIDNASTSTNSAGNYRIYNLSIPGSRIITATCGSYDDYASFVIVNSTVTTHDIVMTKPQIQQTGIVYGQITENGQPLSGVTVSLGGTNVTTGNDGTYRFSDLTNFGALPITSTKTYYIAHSGTVNVISGGSSKHDINMTPLGGSITGTVTSGGSPVADATVTVDGITVKTGSDGTYIISQLINYGDRTITVEKPGYAKTTETINISNGSASERNFGISPTDTTGMNFPSQLLLTGGDPDSVVTADFNNDGAPDVVTEKSVYLGKGNGKFQECLTSTVANTMAVADFNNDGKMDIVENNYIFQGNGNGTFTSKKYISFGSDPVLSITTGDFNGDGKTDFAFVCNNSSGTVKIYQNDGDGLFNFTNIATYTSANYATSIDCGDFNNDGKDDIVTTGGYVFLTNRIGSGFTKTQPGGGSDVEVADFNNDGNPDFVGVSSSSAAVYLNRGDGFGTFLTAKSTSLSEAAYVRAGKFDSDGNADLAIVSRTGDSLTILKGNGDGYFTSKGAYKTGDYPWFLAVSDFNLDGMQDIAVTNKWSSTTSIFINSGNCNFYWNALYATPITFSKLLSADLNGDGRPDIIGESSSYTNFAVSLNNSGSFSSWSTYNTDTGKKDIDVGDLSGDGKPDIAIANGSSNTISIFKNSGSGTFSNTSTITPTYPNIVALKIGDFNGDGRNDIVCVDQIVNYGLSILIQNSDGTFTEHADYNLGLSSNNILEVADINGDGKLDIIFGSSNMTMIGNGDGTFYVGHSGSTVVDRITCADFNNDGKSDTATCYANALDTGAIKAFFVSISNGDGTFTSGSDYNGIRCNKGIKAADFNNDGKIDIATSSSKPDANGHRTALSVFAGNGDGTFQNGLFFNAFNGSDNIYDIVIGDYNLDGKIDAAVSVSGNLEILYQH